MSSTRTMRCPREDCEGEIEVEYEIEDAHYGLPENSYPGSFSYSIIAACTECGLESTNDLTSGETRTFKEKLYESID